MFILSANCDCSTAQENIQKHYDELTYLHIDSMLGNLYSKGVITFKQKEKIKANSTESDRMECFLDRVIIPSLKVNIGIKFQGCLNVMKESGDSILISMAARLGK